jgi:Tol biopolymer transport system component
MAKEPGMPWKLYLIDSEGGKPAPLLNEDRNEADPDWSADGQSIVFGRLPNRMDSRQPKAIYLLNLQTSKVTEIPGSTGLFSPRLSPDGRYIAAIRLDQRALLLFDRAQERWTTLATHGVGDPVWSHDGRSLYFQDFLEAGKPIYRINVPGGEPVSGGHHRQSASHCRNRLPADRSGARRPARRQRPHLHRQPLWSRPGPAVRIPGSSVVGSGIAVAQPTCVWLLCESFPL